jgi:alkylhydroperoxidase/carboxymuconolactone decarboxylase family protein YurZ
MKARTFVFDFCAEGASVSDSKTELDLSPDAILARAKAARGDIFPEWKSVVYASPKTYHLINQTVSYLHQYHGQTAAVGQLSVQMRELIAIPALCAKGDLRHAPNHIRRMYREGLTNKALFEGAAAFATAVGWASLTYVSLAIEQANSPDYPFGKLPPGGEPAELKPFPEMGMGRTWTGTGSQRLLDTEEWRYAAGIDAELVTRASAFVDHCLAIEDGENAILGPGPRALIATAAFCMRGEVGLAAGHIRRAYDYGMTKRQVLDAICCVVPMSGMASATLGLRAMREVDAKNGV